MASQSSDGTTALTAHATDTSDVEAQTPSEPSAPPPPLRPSPAILTGQPTIPVQPPPSYASIYEQLQFVRRQSANPYDFTTKVVTVICSSVFFTMLWACSSIIPIAMIIIGSLNINQCPINEYIPIWLIVAGSVGCLSSLISTTLKTWRLSGDYEGVRYGKYTSIIDLFLLAWLIVGSIWVFQIRPYVDLDNPKSQLFCNRTAYLFAYIIITISWSLTFLMFLCCLCCFPLFLMLGTMEA